MISLTNYDFQGSLVVSSLYLSRWCRKRGAVFPCLDGIFICSLPPWGATHRNERAPANSLVKRTDVETKNIQKLYSIIYIYMYIAL